uniref:Uncharacterized protein n=1 Tax=Strongyloides stercoralis TaxID=6248 RepID=A0A0K0E5Y6_STRER
MASLINSPKIFNSDLVMLFEKLDDIIHVITVLSNKLGFNNFTEKNNGKEAKNIILNKVSPIKEIIHKTIVDMILIKNEPLKKNPKEYKAMKKDLNSNDKNVSQMWIEKEGDLSLFLNNENENPNVSKFKKKMDLKMRRIIKTINKAKFTYFKK